MNKSLILRFICASFLSRLRFICASFFADFRSIRARLFPVMRSTNLLGRIAYVKSVNPHCARFAPDVSSFCARSIATYVDWSAMHHVRLRLGEPCNFGLTGHLPGHFVRIAVPPNPLIAYPDTNPDIVSG